MLWEDKVFTLHVSLQKRSITDIFPDSAFVTCEFCNGDQCFLVCDGVQTKQKITFLVPECSPSHSFT